MIPEIGYSRILRKGKKIFDEIDQGIIEIESTYKFSKNDLYENLFGFVEMYIDDEISDFWDSIAPTYHIVIDEDFNN